MLSIICPGLVFVRIFRKILSVICLGLAFVRIFRKILSGVCLLSGFGPDFLSGDFPDSCCLNSVHCPDYVRHLVKKCCPISAYQDFSCIDSIHCPDSVRIKRKLFVVCLSGRIRTRQSCPDFCYACPPTSAHKIYWLHPIS